MKKMMRTAVWIVAGFVALVAAGIGAFVFHTLTYFRRSMTAVWRAGFVEKQVTINGSEINYAEGPDNGPPLLLISAAVSPALIDSIRRRIVSSARSASS